MYIYIRIQHSIYIYRYITHCRLLDVIIGILHTHIITYLLTCMFYMIYMWILVFPPFRTHLLQLVMTFCPQNAVKSSRFDRGGDGLAWKSYNPATGSVLRQWLGKKYCLWVSLEMGYPQKLVKNGKIWTMGWKMGYTPVSDKTIRNRGSLGRFDFRFKSFFWDINCLRFLGISD